VTEVLADQPDGQLVALSLAGRQVAFAELVRRYKGGLHRLVARIVGDEDEALDVVQETFVAAHQALANYDAARPLSAWLSRIAINKARDWRRRKAARRFISMFLPLEHVLDAVDETPSAETQTSDRQELTNLSRALARLPANLRETLILRTVEGLTQAETAQILGVSEKAVETRLYRARQKLTAILA